jgi:hypothetical protein
MPEKLTLEEAEKAYLLLVARRVLNFQREAEERGEVYHDMSSDIILNNGCGARLRFISVPGSYEPHLWLKWPVGTPLDKAVEVASGILGGPAEDAHYPNELVFRRKKTT